MERFTTIPDEWLGLRLYSWSTGLRIEGCTGGRRISNRVHLDPLRFGLVRVAKGNRKLIRRLKKLTAEVWPVYTRLGKFWNVSHYLVPPMALRLVDLN